MYPFLYVLERNAAKVEKSVPTAWYKGDQLVDYEVAV